MQRSKIAAPTGQCRNIANCKISADNALGPIAIGPDSLYALTNPNRMRGQLRESAHCCRSLLALHLSSDWVRCVRLRTASQWPNHRRLGQPRFGPIDLSRRLLPNVIRVCAALATCTADSMPAKLDKAATRRWSIHSHMRDHAPVACGLCRRHIATQPPRQVVLCARARVRL